MITAVMPTYARTDVAFVRGEGAYIYASDGRRFLDFGAGIAVNALGHCHPHLVQALKTQAETLWHCSNLYNIPGQTKLAERLVAATFADSVFFTNSGVEAMECGFKMIRKYFDETGQPDRYRILACNNAFHGRSLAGISAGGQEKNRKGFAPNVDGFDHVAFGNLNEARAAIRPDTAAILVEPIQGEGGIYPPPADYLKGLRAIADEFGLLLFYDEIQTGMGRTGKLFFHEWSGVTPDIMAVAKGLGGGFPVGACLAVEKAAKALTAGSHGTTFGGNPLAMAAGNAVLDVLLEKGFLGKVEKIAGVLRKKLEGVVKAHPKVFIEVRGAGLMLGLKFVADRDPADFNKKLFSDSLLLVGAGDNVLRLVPPLIIDESHVDAAVAIIERAAVATEKEVAK